MKIKNFKLGGLAILFFAIIFSNGCVPAMIGIHGTGPIVTQTIDMQEFNSINLSIDANVIITKDDAQSVVIEAQQNIINNIRTNVNNDTWDIHYERNVDFHENVTIYINMRNIKRLSITGSGNISTEDEFDSENVDLEITGSGSIYFSGSAINTDSKITGSGDITLEGSSDYSRIVITGSGDYDAYDFTSNSLDVNITGSGDAMVKVVNNLDVDISGSGSVFYKGNPSLNIDISGSGTVKSVN
jgi:hypothetical protein